MTRRARWNLASEYRIALERERTRVAELEDRVRELEHQLDERRRHLPRPRVYQPELSGAFESVGIAFNVEPVQ